MFPQNYDIFSFTYEVGIRLSVNKIRTDYFFFKFVHKIIANGNQRVILVPPSFLNFIIGIELFGTYVLILSPVTRYFEE